VSFSRSITSDPGGDQLTGAARIEFEMNSTQLDERGVRVICPDCGQRNRLQYEKLGQTGRCGECGIELTAPNEPLDMASELAFDALTTRSAFPVVVDFGRPGAPLAKWSRRNSSKLRGQAPGPGLSFKVNTETSPALAGGFASPPSRRWCG
jgi:thioredoxin 2